MKHVLSMLTVGLGFALTATHAAEGQLPVDVFNRLRVEYDDNVNATSSKQDSVKIIEELELLLDSELDNTYLGVRYSPALVYFDDRAGDSTDLNHQFDFILNQKLSPRAVIKIKDTLRITDQPTVVQDDVTIRNNNDFLYNSLNGAFETQLVPEKTTLRVDGRYAMVAYDDSDVADESDYDQIVGGIDIIQRVAPNTDVGGEVRYSQVDYENDLRDSDSVQVGVTVSKIFSPKLQGELRAGYESRTADAAAKSDSDSPYVDGSIVLLPAQKTRVTVGAGFSQDKSPTNKFTQQERTRVYGTVSQGITPALTLHLTGSYAMGSFSTDDATSRFDPATDSDGDENVLLFSASAVYEVNVRNWIEASWQYIELDSDVRPADDFDRNRVSLGWKYRL